MKKTSLLLGAALAMGFASCDDMLPDPQLPTLPEDVKFESSDLAIAQQNKDVTIDLDAAASTGTSIVLADITTLNNWPASYDLVFTFEVSNTPDFAKTASFNAAVDGNQIVTPASTINTLVYETFTKDPLPIKIYTRISAYATKGATTSMQLGGNGYLYGSYEYTVKPFEPDVTLAREYYLLYRPIGTTDYNNVKFEKAVPSLSVYDDATFSMAVDAPAAGLEWLVCAGPLADNVLLSPVPAPQDPDMAHGTLTALATAAPAVIPDAGPYLITMNAATGNYTVVMAYPTIYVPSAATSLTAPAKWLQLFTTDYIKYKATMRLYNSWYLTTERATDKGVFFGLGEKEVAEDGTITASLVQYDNNGDVQQIDKATSLLYYIEFNIAALTVKAQPIKTIQLIGSFNGWNLAEAPEMTMSQRYQVWTIKGVQLNAGEGFKFCVDHSWDLSFGGTKDNIVQNGGDMTVAESGTYDIVLDFRTQPNFATFTKK